MIRTQIQLPDALYRDLQRLARSKEWSLAETLRRAAEQFLARHPHAGVAGEWFPPSSAEVGWRGLSHQEVHERALEEMEAEIRQVDGG